MIIAQDLPAPLLAEFPDLGNDVCWDHELLHVQMGVFARHTQSAERQEPP